MYVTPTTNPIPGRVAFGYGFSGYRGLGDVALNCPGDPGCPGNVQPLDVLNLPLTGLYTGGLPGSTVPVNAPLALGAGGQLSTSEQIINWLNANPWLMIAGGAVLLLMLLEAR